MRELEYPFDGKSLMRKRKSVKKKLLKNNTDRIKKNIAVLGGSTTNDVVEMLDLFLLNHGIEGTFYQSEYGKYWEDSVFKNDELDSFKPDIIYIHTTSRNISSFPDLDDDTNKVKELLDSQYNHFQEMWSSLIAKYSCIIIQNNFDLPHFRPMGNKEASDIHGMVNFISKLNIMFYNFASKNDGFYINDINYQSAIIGLDKWHDPFCWYMYKYAVSFDAIPILTFNVSNIIKSIYGKNKKAFALDLDNTLWGGIIGDDGIEGISIGNETSQGQIFLEFQKYLKRVQEQGVILNIISKNEEENVQSGLNHPQMFLKPYDFVSIKANWEAKSDNLIELSKELSLGVDSFVFVDDNPVEREILRAQVPGTAIPELERPERYITAIDRAGYFEVTAFSQDDKKRGEMYKGNIKRDKIQRKFKNYEDFLLSLNMNAEIKPFEPIYIDRIAQLTNKSNQFNLTTRRYSRKEIEEIAANKSYLTFYGRLSDCFGDNGIVSVVIGKIAKKDILDIILWLMSCRVLKRDMELAMMDEVVSKARSRGIKQIKGYYYPTKKNSMVRDFYSIYGFKKILEDDSGNSEWVLDLTLYKNTNRVIRVNNGGGDR